MNLYLIYRNGEFQMQCHADNESDAIQTALQRMGFDYSDMFENDWSAERE